MEMNELAAQCIRAEAKDLQQKEIAELSALCIESENQDLQRKEVDELTALCLQSGSDEMGSVTEKSPENWTEKSVDKILDAVGPKVSGRAYNIAWQKFEIFRRTLKEATNPLAPPEEADYLKYLDYLRETRKYASSSLWSTFSKLNNVHQVLLSLLTYIPTYCLY